MDKFEKVLEIIEDYRGTADRLFADYKKAEATARKKYSEAGFHQEFILNEYPLYAGKLRSEADDSVRKANDIFDDLQEQLEEWIVKPVQPDILATLNYIRNFGLRLTLKELQILEKNIVGSYFGVRLFAAIATESGFAAQYVDADTLIDALDSARSITESTIRAYAGRGGEAGFPGRDLLPHKIRNGCDFGEYAIYELSIASHPTKNGSIETASKLWQQAKAPLHYELTTEETKRLEQEINGLVNHLGQVDEVGAGKLREKMPDILSRIHSLPKDKEYKKAEALEKFYVLGRSENKKGDTEPKTESILKTLPAKNYAINHGQANADILNQY